MGRGGDRTDRSAEWYPSTSLSNTPIDGGPWQDWAASAVPADQPHCYQALGSACQRLAPGGIAQSTRMPGARRCISIMVAM